MGWGGLIAVLAALGFATPAAAAEPIRGWIEIERNGASVRFTGVVQGEGASEIRYELLVTKEGKSGRTNSTQGGRARLSGEGRQRLSQSSVNIEDGDDYCVRLSIYQSDRLVAAQTVTSAGNGGACGR